MVSSKGQDHLLPRRLPEGRGKHRHPLSPEGKNLVGVGSVARSVPPRDGGGRTAPSWPTRVTLLPLPALLILLVG